MSDDEGVRRRAPFLGLLGLLVLVAFAFWLRSQVLADFRAFAAFCNATHAGEPWEHVQERASSHDWALVRQSREGATPQEWLYQFEEWSYRNGCVVVLEKGRVVRTRLATLPDD